MWPSPRQDSLLRLRHPSRRGGERRYRPVAEMRSSLMSDAEHLLNHLLATCGIFFGGSLCRSLFRLLLRLPLSLRRKSPLVHCCMLTGFIIT